MAVLCRPMIAPAPSADDRSQPSSPKVRRRAAISAPMMANGAQSVSAQERPTQATKIIAPVCDVTKKVVNIAVADIMCAKIQACLMLNRRRLSIIRDIDKGKVPPPTVS